MCCHSHPAASLRSAAGIIEHSICGVSHVTELMLWWLIEGTSAAAQLAGTYCRWMIPGLIPFVFSLSIMKARRPADVDTLSHCPCPLVCKHFASAATALE